MYLEPESSWVKQDSELNMELHYKDERQMRSPGLKDGESKKELEPDNSSCVTCFVQNPSMLQTYVTNTCKLGHNFGNSFTGFVFLTMLFSFYNS